MGWYHQDHFSLRLEWGMEAVNQLATEVDCAIIVDVMSFSTCVSLAVDKGALIYPYPFKDASALIYGNQLGAQTANIDRRFSGEGYSLSPQSLLAIPAATRLVLPSPNGSAISFAARDKGIAVFSAGLRNMAATARACQGFERILLIPCGERWPDGSLRPAIEDYVAAGGIIAALNRANLSPEAEMAQAGYQYAASQKFAALHQCSSARELQQRGFAADVELCLAAEAGQLACRLQDNVYQGISA